MNIRVPVVTIALASTIGATACGSGGGDDSDRAQTISVPSSAAPPAAKGGGDKTLTEAQLKDALLTVTDLPTGYKVDPDPSEDDDETTGENAECSKKFKSLDDDDTDGTKVAEMEANFEGPQLGSVLQQSLASYKNEDGLSEQFDKVASVLSECPRFSTVDKAGEKTDFTIGALSFPKLGDNTLALGINIKTPDISATANIVVVRVGRNLMMVTQGGLTADVALLEQASRKGLDKLAAAVEA